MAVPIVPAPMMVTLQTHLSTSSVIGYALDSKALAVVVTVAGNSCLEGLADEAAIF